MKHEAEDAYRAGYLVALRQGPTLCSSRRHEGAGTRPSAPANAESANGQSAVDAESIQLLATLGEGLSDESLRSISDFIRYLHERETRGRENGGSVTPSAIQSERPSNTAHPDGQRLAWATKKARTHGPAEGGRL